MKKLLKLTGITALAVITLIAALLVKAASNQRRQAEDQKMMVKADEALHNKASKSPAQERMAREAEAYTGGWISAQY